MTCVGRVSFSKVFFLEVLCTDFRRSCSAGSILHQAIFFKKLSISLNLISRFLNSQNQSFPSWEVCEIHIQATFKKCSLRPLPDRARHSYLNFSNFCKKKVKKKKKAVVCNNAILLVFILWSVKTREMGVHELSLQYLTFSFRKKEYLVRHGEFARYYKICKLFKVQIVTDLSEPFIFIRDL